MDNPKLTLPVVLFALFFLISLSGWQADKARCSVQPKYVGSEGCKECHSTEYDSFKKFNKKAHSFQSISRLKKGLSEAELKKCYECHTTGYGKEGGFQSEQATPKLKDAGCEVCHGPGSIHAETGDPKDIKGKLTAKDCESCHNAERVDSFKYKPLVYGGAH
jgi:RecJ-like exonuclease